MGLDRTVNLARATAGRWRQHASHGTARLTHLARTARWFNRPAVLYLSIAAYAIMLHLTYAYRISPVFFSIGLRYRTPNIAWYVIAILLVFMLAYFLPARLKKPSDIIVWILFVMTGAPSILVPQYADVISQKASTELGIAVACSLLLVILLADHGPRLSLSRFRPSSRIVWLALILFSVVVYGYMFQTVGLSIKFISLTGVQSTRFAYREAIASHGTLLAYLIGTQGYVVNTFVMARGMYTRRWFLAFGGAIGQMLIYSITGYKMMILSIPAALGILFLFRRSDKPFGRLIIDGTVAVGILALLADVTRGAGQYYTFTVVFIARLMLIPGALTAAYVHFFDGSQKAEWGYSFLSRFVDYPYSSSPAMLVGEQFSGDAKVAANVSFFGDGYANLGYLGIAIEALVIVALLWALNAAAEGLPMKVTSVVLLLPALGLANTSAFTSLLTGGCAVAVVVLFAIPREGWEPSAERATGVRTALRVRSALAARGRPERP